MSTAAAAAAAATPSVSAATSAVAQDTTSDTNYVLQFEQAEAPPPYTLATSAESGSREQSRTREGRIEPIPNSPVLKFAQIDSQHHLCGAAAVFLLGVDRFKP